MPTHLPDMTTTLLNLRPSTKGSAETALRCDVCGDRVTDPAKHVRACLDHELTMFALGRRAS
ncbi:hypothetical protein GCM10027067_24690 [Pseudactinotalea suaedae]